LAPYSAGCKEKFPHRPLPGHMSTLFGRTSAYFVYYRIPSSAETHNADGLIGGDGCVLAYSRAAASADTVSADEGIS